MHAHKHTYTDKQSHTHTHTHTHIHTHTHTHTHVHMLAYTHTHMNTYIHTHAHMCTCTHIHTHTWTHIHTQRLAHMHTYIQNMHIDLKHTLMRMHAMHSPEQHEWKTCQQIGFSPERISAHAIGLLVFWCFNVMKWVSFDYIQPSVDLYICGNTGIVVAVSAQKEHSSAIEQCLITNIEQGVPAYDMQLSQCTQTVDVCSLLYTWLCLFHDAPLILPVSWHVLLSLFQDRYLVSMKGALYCVSWQAPNCTCSITNTQLCLFHDLSYWACFMKNAQLCMFHDKCPTACVSWRNAQLRMFHDRCPTGPVPNCTPFMTSAQLHLFNNRCWSMPVWWQMSDLVTLPVSQQM